MSRRVTSASNSRRVSLMVFPDGAAPACGGDATGCGARHPGPGRRLAADKLVAYADAAFWRRMATGAAAAVLLAGVAQRQSAGHSRLLLLDEPTNSLDVAQKVALDRLLREFCQRAQRAGMRARSESHPGRPIGFGCCMLPAGGAGRHAEVMALALLSQIYEVDFQLQWVGDQR